MTENTNNISTVAASSPALETRSGSLKIGMEFNKNPAYDPNAPKEAAEQLASDLAELKGEQGGEVKQTEAGAAEEEKKILGKFKSQEDLEKAYRELEKKLGTPASQEKPSSDENAEVPKEGEGGPEEKPDDKAEEKDTLEEAAEEAGIDVGSYEKEFLEKGGLSDESYEKLAKDHKLPREVVDDFIAMRLNRAEAITNRINEAAGGADQVPVVLEWASKNLTPAEIDAFNLGMQKVSSPEEAVLLMTGLRSRFDRATPSAPQRTVEASVSTTGSAGGYATESDWKAEFRTPQYRNDPTFRAKVDAKLQASPWFKNGA